VSDSSKVVQITDYKVSIAHHFDSSKLELESPLFSEINNFYSNTKKKGIPVEQQLSLNSLLERLNTIKHKLSKNNSISILKGLYQDGTSGVFCYESVPFLFFDIDVKKGENEHLLDSYANSKVFTKLLDIGVLVWRSDSGKGMAGVLYIPQLKGIGNIDKTKHLAIGNAITDYLTKTLKVNAKFDKAQNKFRQVRYLALQQEKIRLNINPYVFQFEVSEILKISNSGVKQFRYEDNRTPFGSIEYQFNQDNDIHTALINNGFIQTSSHRYKHPRTNSKDTGEVANNLFFNYSSSFSDYKVFTPFKLYLAESYIYDLKRFYKCLKVKGYKYIEPEENAFKEAEKNLKQKATNRSEQIFKACYDLVNAPYKNKVKFADDNAKTPAEKVQFYDYLKIKPLTIEYDKTLLIKSYVSEQLPNILDYSDGNDKIVLTAETGTGKTTAFLMDFIKHRPNKRLLILAPLTAIVEQTKAEFPTIITLTGNSTPEDHIKAKKAPIVMATYEQGYKHLRDPNTFDYVVIDEVHNLITANGYKREAVKNLTSLLDSYKIIGLTGTTNQLFKYIGYKLVNVKKELLNPVDVTMIIDNRNPLKIALQHLRGVNGKCILRINSRKVATALKIELLKRNSYKESEILILNSDTHIKKSKDFKQLTSQSRFNHNIKLVITTSIIDEGLSIKQSGFTDAVFIETDYKPMPESVKQFFARFRNEDPNRKNYFYYKETKDQTLRSWNPYYTFLETKKNLTADAKIFDVNDTDKKGIISTKYLYYENSSVNNYALAYDVAKKFFTIMTKQEYINFLELNYNINIIENKNHISVDFDTTESKHQTEQNKILVATNWLNNKDEVLNALYIITDNFEVKKSIAYIGLNPSDEIYNLVSTNLKTFEGLHKSSVILERLGINDVDDILIDKVKNTPIDIRNINRKIQFYQNLDIINNPLTKTDELNKSKLLKFITVGKKLKIINNKTLFREWNKLRCNSKNPSYYNLSDLLNHYKNNSHF
jgi:hypothetical protein|tara:strand:+ start:1773 stop:4754 length:2982 start_codon:yes stop_codon:yes gene_type:complete